MDQSSPKEAIEAKMNRGNREINEKVANTAASEHIMQFFAYQHLPPHLQAVSKPFGELAQAIVGERLASDQFPLPRNPERTVALRKLLEAKDAAVRALLAK